MGICISAKGSPFSMDMGPGAFMRMRTAIAIHIGVWKDGSPYQLPYLSDDNAWETFVGNLNSAIADGRISHHTARFLVACDCGARFMPGSCEAILKDIADMPEQDDRYGYVWSKHASIGDFRKLLDYCAQNRRVLKWS